ncbi:hypothetical protein WDW37_18730 [Bdellovibrionota bacterium FG-1]
MSLRTTSVAKCLDKKLLLMGFEVPDVLAIFLTLSVLNFVFGQMPLKLLFVWLPTVALAAVLLLGKKGKPDNYLIHWLRFQIKPGTLHAFPDPSQWNIPPRPFNQRRSA